MIDPAMSRYNNCVSTVNHNCRDANNQLNTACVNYYTAACYAQLVQDRRRGTRAVAHSTHGLGMTENAKGLLYLGILVAGGALFGMLSDSEHRRSARARG